MIHRGILVLAAIALLSAAPVFAADATGRWTTTISTQIGALDYVYEFKVDGEKLTGKAKSQFGEIEMALVVAGVSLLINTVEGYLLVPWATSTSVLCLASQIAPFFGVNFMVMGRCAAMPTSGTCWM